MPQVDKASFTAISMEIAALRALKHYFSEELFSDRYIQIAEFICKSAIAATLKNNPQVRLFHQPYAEQTKLAIQMMGIPLDEHSLGRKTFILKKIRNAIEDEEFKQIVVLGGGDDPRLLEEAIRYHQRYPEVQFYELDKGETFTIKHKALKRFQTITDGFSIPENFHAVECDLMNPDLFSTLPDNFDSNKKTLFVAEGVTSYLSEDAVVNLFKKIKLLGNHKFLVSFTPGEFAIGKVEAQGLKNADEVHQFHLNPRDMISYFNALGFTLQAKVTHRELHDTMASLTNATVPTPPQNREENYVLLTTEYTTPQENNINSIPVLEELKALLTLQVNPHYDLSSVAAV